jgi:hypothetical protein
VNTSGAPGKVRARSVIVVARSQIGSALTAGKGSGFSSFTFFAVLEREPGVAQPFESVRSAVALSLRQQSYVAAVRQYLQLAHRGGPDGGRGPRRSRHTAGSVAALESPS